MSNKTLLVITSYPPESTTHSEQIVGVASYTKNTLVAMQKVMTPDESIVVLGEKLSGYDVLSDDSGITVKRVWERNKLSSFWHLFQQILSYPSAKTVMVALELSMFGGKNTLVAFVLFTLLLKLLGRRVIIVSHQVIEDIKEFHGHINIPDRGIIPDMINASVRLFYFFLLRIVDTVIVFDTVLRERLAKFGPRQKIVVIPHGVEEFDSPLTKKDARKQLGISQSKFVVLCFGFLAWYKGTDWLVDAFQELRNKENVRRHPGNPAMSGASRRSWKGRISEGFWTSRRSWKGQNDVQLIIAGGPNPNHMDKDFYRKYIARIEKVCKEAGITLTGFVPENEMASYFKACDLFVFPYRTFMSASGPLSFAFSFGKPFLVSEQLQAIYKTPDIQLLLEQEKLAPSDMTFSLTAKDFVRALRRVQKHKEILSQIAKLSTELAKVRSFARIGEEYSKLCFA